MMYKIIQFQPGLEVGVEFHCSMTYSDSFCVDDDSEGLFCDEVKLLNRLFNTCTEATGCESTLLAFSEYITTYHSLKRKVFDCFNPKTETLTFILQLALDVAVSFDLISAKLRDFIEYSELDEIGPGLIACVDEDMPISFLDTVLEQLGIESAVDVESCTSEGELLLDWARPLKEAILSKGSIESSVFLSQPSFGQALNRLFQQRIKAVQADHQSGASAQPASDLPEGTVTIGIWQKKERMQSELEPYIHDQLPYLSRVQRKELAKALTQWHYANFVSLKLDTGSSHIKIEVLNFFPLPKGELATAESIEVSLGYLRGIGIELASPPECELTAAAVLPVSASVRGSVSSPVTASVAGKTGRRAVEKSELMDYIKADVEASGVLLGAEDYVDRIVLGLGFDGSRKALIRKTVDSILSGQRSFDDSLYKAVDENPHLYLRHNRILVTKSSSLQDLLDVCSDFSKIQQRSSMFFPSSNLTTFRAAYQAISTRIEEIRRYNTKQFQAELEGVKKLQRDLDPFSAHVKVMIKAIEADDISSLHAFFSLESDLCKAFDLYLLKEKEVLSALKTLDRPEWLRFAREVDDIRRSLLFTHKQFKIALEIQVCAHFYEKEGVDTICLSDFFNRYFPDEDKFLTRLLKPIKSYQARLEAERQERYQYRLMLGLVFVVLVIAIFGGIFLAGYYGAGMTGSGSGVSRGGEYVNSPDLSAVNHQFRDKLHGALVDEGSVFKFSDHSRRNPTQFRVSGRFDRESGVLNGTLTESDADGSTKVVVQTERGYMFSSDKQQPGTLFSGQFSKTISRKGSYKEEITYTGTEPDLTTGETNGEMRIERYNPQGTLMEDTLIKGTFDGAVAHRFRSASVVYSDSGLLRTVYDAAGDVHHLDRVVGVRVEQSSSHGDSQVISCRYRFPNRDDSLIVSGSGAIGPSGALSFVRTPRIQYSGTGEADDLVEVETGDLLDFTLSQRWGRSFIARHNLRGASPVVASHSWGHAAGQSGLKIFEQRLSAQLDKGLPFVVKVSESQEFPYFRFEGHYDSLGRTLDGSLTEYNERGDVFTYTSSRGHMFSVPGQPLSVIYAAQFHQELRLHSGNRLTLDYSGTEPDLTDGATEGVLTYQMNPSQGHLINIRIVGTFKGAYVERFKGVIYREEGDDIMTTFDSEGMVHRIGGAGGVAVAHVGSHDDAAVRLCYYRFEGRQETLLLTGLGHLNGDGTLTYDVPPTIAYSPSGRSDSAREVGPPGGTRHFRLTREFGRDFIAQYT